jgi:hypothetical protein
MSDFTPYTDTALYAELAGRESTLGLKGMAARLNDREISRSVVSSRVASSR